MESIAALPPPADIARALADIVGTGACLADAPDMAPYVTDYRRLYRGSAACVVFPRSTQQVSEVMAWCHARRVPVVPQGGNTSLMGGAVPAANALAVVINLSRMNQVLEIDATNDTLTVQAGVTLNAARAAAEEAGRLFPLRIGSEGSCQIGGNLATNAGGTAVLRYGNMRDLVLGLEVVLPDGERLDLLRGLRKDNTGYDLKQLFIGAEGTLGIITAATVKLFPAPSAEVVAFAGVSSIGQAVRLLGAMRGHLGERFTAFELISSASVDLVRHYFPDTPSLLEGTYPWYVLMEAADGGGDEALHDAMQTALMACLEDDCLQDVALAGNLAQGQTLWMLRENITHAQQMDGSNIKHDVSLPISRIPAFVEQMLAQLQQAFPEARPIVYGHLGDGNLHFNVSAPVGIAPAMWQRETDAVNKLIHDVVAAMRGSISAEHGIGQLKRHEMALYKTQAELDVMRRIKQALDPHGLMNPGKVL